MKRIRILTTPYKSPQEVVTMNAVDASNTERPTTLLIIDADLCKSTATSTERSTYV